MESVAARDFAIRVTPAIDMVDDHVARLVAGIYRVQLNWTTYDIILIPFEPKIAPRIDGYATARKKVKDRQTAADARLEFFYSADFVVTPYEAAAGREIWFPAKAAAPDHGVGGDRKRREPKDGVVYYTSAEQYKILSANLDQLVEPHSDETSEKRALEPEGRPVIDYLVDRLLTSRLPRRAAGLAGRPAHRDG